MRAFISKVRKRISNHASQSVLLAGMGLIAYGIALVVCVPAGIIAGGVFLVAIAIDMRI